MSKFWSTIVRNLVPYVPGEQPKDKKYIKLNTNENPYPPSPRVLEAIKKAANGDLRLYPDPEFHELRDTVAKYYGLSREEVYAGNGSDELLAFSFQAFFEPGKKIIFPDITYSFYPVYCKLYNLDYETVPLDDEFNVPVNDFLRENGGIIISNPKAPTAKYMGLDEIRSIVEYNKDSVVIIDEAYIDFGGESAVKLIKDYNNLLVIQTMSKSRCLAGLRLGLVMGSKELIDGIIRIKNSFNSYPVDRLALAGAVEAIRDEEYFRETVNKIINTREWVAIKLKELGFYVLESKANFLFISHSKINAEVLFNHLRENGILVRFFKKPRIDNFLRVTIGTDSEMEEFVRVVKMLEF
ncbi:MAG TPA: histidinol-phosphate transaminase [Pseudobacteroides sp.]|nr:histidinol-phosphate transaminase [Pseudobacteroides sp.]